VLQENAARFTGTVELELASALFLRARQRLRALALAQLLRPVRAVRRRDWLISGTNVVVMDGLARLFVLVHLCALTTVNGTRIVGEMGGFKIVSL